MNEQNKADIAMKQLIQRLFNNNKTDEDKRVYIINGAPGSGKTSYVMEKKTNNDLVVDMDKIVSALRGEKGDHLSYDTVMEAALAAREAIYNTIKERRGRWKTAYVIVSNPSKEYVGRLAKTLQGEIINMDVDKKTCTEHILNDNTREDKERDLRLMEKWYETQRE